MSRVTFVWNPNGLEGLGEIRIEVDGRNLAEVVGAVEGPSAAAEGRPDLAGSYVGLCPAELSDEVRKHFMGVPGSDLACGPRDKTVLLGCTCGYAGCWPLMARVEVGADKVVWSDFEQPHRRDTWSYVELDQLAFDHAEYEAGLDRVQAQIPEHE